MSEMGLEFIGRTLRTFGIVLLCFLPFGGYYLGIFPSLAILSGGIWGMINLMFISALVQAAIRPDGADVGRTVGLMLIKFPALYIAGYFLLKVPQFSAVNLLIGFSGIMAIMLLKVLGRLLLGLDSHRRHNPQGAIL
jgi:hypothetical protein